MLRDGTEDKSSTEVVRGIRSRTFFIPCSHAAEHYYSTACRVFSRSRTLLQHGLPCALSFACAQREAFFPLNPGRRVPHGQQANEAVIASFVFFLHARPAVKGEAIPYPPKKPQPYASRGQKRNDSPQSENLSRTRHAVRKETIHHNLKTSAVRVTRSRGEAIPYPPKNLSRTLLVLKENCRAQASFPRRLCRPQRSILSNFES